MSKLRYPDRETLERWTDLLGRSTFFVGHEFPHCDTEWYNRMSDAIELLKLPHYPDTLHHKGAHLFYKIAKGHRIANENKRSAVVVLYLFYLLNEYVISTSPDTLLEVARSTAKSNAQNHEKEIVRLEKALEEIVLPIR